MNKKAKPNVYIVIDCHDLEALLDFWAAALGYRRIGIKDEYGLLLPHQPLHPPVLLQRVPESRRPRRPACTSTSAPTTWRPYIPSGHELPAFRAVTGLLNRSG